MTSDWASFKVTSDKLHIPDSIYYVPNFVTVEEEEQLLKQINNAPKPKWTTLSNRRLQNWGGFPHPKITVGEPLPVWLKSYTEKLLEMDVFEGKEPNHVLVNEYKPGQGIMPHEDGPLFYPTITTVSLASHTVLNLSPKDSVHDPLDTFSLLLEPRSLLIIKKEAYTSYLHGIEEITSDRVCDRIVNLSSVHGITSGEVVERGRRISLTIRFVSNMRKDLFSKLYKK